MRVRSLKRMEEIVEYVSCFHGVLAVAAFGSNASRERFDDYSDLDFLVLVEPALKNEILGQISRLETLGSIDAIQIQYNDAVKILFSDGVFCDFGVVTPDQLGTFFHGNGVYLWSKDGWSQTAIHANEPPAMTENDLVLDTFLHLCIGLIRVARGEEAAAFFEIQVEAARKLLTILEGENADVFSPLRRAEGVLDKKILCDVMPGYGRSIDAAKAILHYIPHSKDHKLYKSVGILLEIR